MTVDHTYKMDPMSGTGPDGHPLCVCQAPMSEHLPDIHAAISQVELLGVALKGPRIEPCWINRTQKTPCLELNKGIDQMTLLKAGSLCLPCEAFVLSCRLSRTLRSIRRHQAEAELEAEDRP